ncbi:4'-phosphopantetheinyl transferase family protein [Kitasatospora sp. NPDC001660]
MITTATPPALPMRGATRGPVRWAEAFGDGPQAPLLPAEAAHIAGRPERRTRQFTVARTLARRALEQLGYAPTPLLPGAGGAPVWPDGVVGSITHCNGYTACAVAPAGRLASLGIDAEPARPLPAGILGLTASAAEQDGLAQLPPGEAPWDRLLFSAKEAAYKAWYPLTRQWAPLAETPVTVHPDGTFTTHRDGRAFTGRWHHTGGILITTIALP